MGTAIILGFRNILRFNNYAVRDYIYTDLGLVKNFNFTRHRVYEKE